MRRFAPALLACLVLAGCGGSQSDTPANALDNAAAQSDPAAAAELHNQADAVRNEGADVDLAAPGSAAQDAMQSAGNAAAANGAAPR